eukprot:CAMPEP_0194344964 /NCGR_PEP_ID=MMETSP0171-20130528/103769_1 /TAXON_ID=218684 /ORGANISM="Corethron pennatum, Strain L29A3" /LENGTH=71 /DNA_ID=CAMNT_0039111837 /DNA_START=230 /DNA_END=443 /DNA_ORIENTATION=-
MPAAPFVMHADLKSPGCTVLLSDQSVEDTKKEQPDDDNPYQGQTHGPLSERDGGAGGESGDESSSATRACD